jgi:hypothetical protein
LSSGGRQGNERSSGGREETKGQVLNAQERGAENQNKKIRARQEQIRLAVEANVRSDMIL